MCTATAYYSLVSVGREIVTFMRFGLPTAPSVAVWYLSLPDWVAKYGRLADLASQLSAGHFSRRGQPYVSLAWGALANAKLLRPTANHDRFVISPAKLSSIGIRSYERRPY